MHWKVSYLLNKALEELEDKNYSCPMCPWCEKPIIMKATCRINVDLESAKVVVECLDCGYSEIVLDVQ